MGKSTGVRSEVLNPKKNVFLMRYIHSIKKFCSAKASQNLIEGESFSKRAENSYSMKQTH